MAEKLNKRKVIVIGNGLSGSSLTAALAKVKAVSMDITVITPFDFTEVPLRMTLAVAAGATVHDKAIYPLVKENGVNYVIGKVSKLVEGLIELEGGDSIPFDIAIVATGMNVPIFQMDPKVITADERKSQIRDIHSKIVSANTIIISGAGAIGSELAADIKLRNPAKRVVIVTKDDAVLKRMSPALSAIATKKIQEMGVEVITSDSVTSFASGEVKLQSGKTIIADVYIPCHAATVNSSFMPANTLNDKKFIKVDDKLKVIGLRNVFALGDVSDKNPNKAAVAIDEQVPIISGNIQAIIQNKPLKSYSPGMMGKATGPLMVALGHEHEKGYGLGPDLPGCMGYCCWICCCGAPSGHRVAKMKSDFNNSITPKLGKGIH